MATAADVLTGRPGAEWAVAQGDAARVLPSWPAGTVHLAITSPPYYKLRSYLGEDHPDREAELGGEKVPDCLGWARLDGPVWCGACYVCRLVAVFREVRRVLRDDGVCVVNLGDSFSRGNGSKNGQVAAGEKQKTNHGTMAFARSGDIPDGFQDGDLLGIPFRFALAMQADGWLWRSDVRWVKKAPMPSSVSGWRWERHRIKVRSGNRAVGEKKYATTADRPQGARLENGASFDSRADYEDCPGCPKCAATGGLVLRKGSWRPTCSHEPVFVFAKEPGYYGDAVRTPAAASTLSRDQYSRITSGKDGDYAVQHDHETPTNPLGANLRDTLVLGPEPNSCALILSPLADCPVHKGQAGPIYVDRPPKSWKRCRCAKTGHYASFPSTLVEPFLKAYCPARCCGTCGAGWARVVEREEVQYRPNSASNRGTSPYDLHANPDSPQRGAVGCEIETLGWRPTCSCPATDPIPGLVLDVFSGSGTTVLTVRRMGLRAVGVELSEAYALLSRFRIQGDNPLFNTITPEEAP